MSGSAPILGDLGLLPGLAGALRQMGARIQPWASLPKAAAAAAGKGATIRKTPPKPGCVPTALPFPAAVRRGPHLRAPGPARSRGSRSGWGGGARPPARESGPALGRSEGGAEPRGEHSRLQSPPGQPRLGDRPTEPGREPPEQGSGERVSSLRRRLPAALCGLTPRRGLRVAAGRWSRPLTAWLGV